MNITCAWDSTLKWDTTITKSYDTVMSKAGTAIGLAAYLEEKAKHTNLKSFDAKAKFARIDSFCSSLNITVPWTSELLALCSPRLGDPQVRSNYFPNVLG